MRRFAPPYPTPVLNNPPHFDPSVVTEFGDLSAENLPFKELFLACKNGDTLSASQHFNHWWQCMCLVLLNAQRESLINEGHPDSGNALLPKIETLRKRGIASHPVATFIFNPLHIAAAYGNREVLRSLIRKVLQRSGQNPQNIRAAYGLSNFHPMEVPRLTALDFACKYNHQEIILDLLYFAVNDPKSTKPIQRPVKNPAGETLITIDNLDSKTPLMWCIEHKMDIKLIALLLQHLKRPTKKMYINHRCSPDGQTALEMAMTDNNAPLVRMLLINGASCNLRRPLSNDPESQFPLSFSLSLAKNSNSNAEREAQRDITQLLLVFGAVIPSIEEQPHINNIGTSTQLKRCILVIHPDTNLNTPGFYICKAIISLLEPADECRMEGYAEPIIFLNRLLEYLPRSCAFVENIVLREINKEEKGWFNTKNIASLNNKNFSYYLLRALSENPDLLRSLKMRHEDYTQFSEKSTVRSAFFKQLVQKLYDYIKCPIAVVSLPEESSTLRMNSNTTASI